MKNIFKLIGIIAIVAVIGLSMVACGGDDGTNPQTVGVLAASTLSVSPSGTVTAGTTVFFNWTSIAGASGYTLYCNSILGSVSSGWVPERTTSTSDSFTTSTDDAGWTFQFKVAAYNANGTEGAMSNVVSITVTGGGTPTTYSLNGIWAREDGTIISIYDGKAVFTDILTTSAWKEVEKKGNIKIGDSYWRNITKTGDLTWRYENLTYNTSTYALGSWESGTITLNSNGQTFTNYVPNTQDQRHTFTRKTVSTLDGIWEREDGTIISIYDDKAVFSNILTTSAWKEVEKRGNIKIGDSYWRNITKTGDLTWRYENLTYNTSTYAILGWESGTITLNSNGQTFTNYVPNTVDQRHTFTKR